MINKVRYRNFKAFKNLDLDLAPITLLLGPNNSGKSSVLSGLKILNQTLSSTDPNVSMLLKGHNGDFGTYKDVVHGNSGRSHLDLGIEVERKLFKGDKILRRPKVEMNVKYKYRTVLQEIIAKEISVSTKRSSLVCSYSEDTEKYVVKSINKKEVPSNIRSRISKGLRMENYLPFYRMRYISNEDGESVTSNFLDSINEVAVNNSIRACSDLRNELTNVEYIGAMRLPPQRTFMYTGEKRKSVGSNGEFSVNILAMDTLRKGKKSKNIKMKVENWLDIADIASELRINKISDRHFELMIKNKHTQEFENYADVGYGNSQIIPVLVAGYNLESGSTLIIEEPEIHLHPKAQFCIGDYLCELRREEVQTLVETHSEHLIIRMQQLVAMGELDPDDVAIYYIWSNEDGKQYQKISFDDEGQFIGEWPLGFFPERYEAAKVLSKIRYGVL